MNIPRLFDCHSHWATRRGYLFRTEAELARQEAIWKTPVQYFTEDEQADYLRKNHVRAILDISWIKRLPIEEMREHNDYVFGELLGLSGEEIEALKGSGVIA